MVSIEIEFEMKFQKPFYMDFAKLMKFDTVTEYHILYVWYIRSVVKWYTLIEQLEKLLTYVLEYLGEDCWVDVFSTLTYSNKQLGYIN